MRNRSKFKSWVCMSTRRNLLHAKSDSGQAIVELAFMLPVALMLLLGIAEIGRYANESIIVDHAARAGAQYAAQNSVTASNTADIVQAAKDDAPGVTDLTVTPSTYCTCADGASSTCQPTDCSGSRIIEYVKVNTETQIQSLFHYPGLPQAFTVKGQDIMRVSQ